MKLFTLTALAISCASLLCSGSLATVPANKQKASARLFGPTTLKGWVKYDDRQRSDGSLSQRVRVHVERGVSNQDVPVFINGAMIGLVHTNAGGAGNLVMRTDSGHSLPDGFPRLDTGDMVNVGETSGFFFDSQVHDLQRVRLAGEGADDVGHSAEVQYQERFRNGTLNRRFKVEVNGAADGETFDVTINGQFIATITAHTDDDGDGEGDAEVDAELQMRSDAHGEDDDTVPMPSTFPTLHDGDVVMVGSMTVTLAQTVCDDGDGDDDGGGSEPGGGGGDD